MPYLAEARMAIVHMYSRGACRISSGWVNIPEPVCHRCTPMDNQGWQGVLYEVVRDGWVKDVAFQVCMGETVCQEKLTRFVLFFGRLLKIKAP
jgi:hypothetical protein